MNLVNPPPTAACDGNVPSGPPPYPLGRFHRVASHAAIEIQNNVKAPDAMIGVSILSAISTTCMGLISVRHPKSNQICSVSLNSLVVADSGERKTAIDNLVMRPLQQRDDLREKKYQDHLSAYLTEKFVWDAVKRSLQAEIIRATKNGDPVDLLAEKVSEHVKAMPIKPRERRLIRQDITGRAIMDAIQGNRELIALFSSEGDVILRSDAMRQVGLLNTLWDAPGLMSLDRAKGNIVARDPRGTVSFMVQEAILADYLARRGKVVRGSGHWARYLVAWPASTQGFRFMSYTDTVWTHLPEFHARLDELLDEYERCREVGNLEPEVIEFSDEARSEWITVANNIEADLQPMRYLNDIKDFSSKAMEITSRIAALLHKFSKQQGSISVDTFQRAFAFVDWHIHEFKRIFSPNSQHVVPQVLLDAEALEHYLLRVFWCRGHHAVPKNLALQRGPIRHVKALDEAIQNLRLHNKVRISTGPNRERCLELNPNYFGSLPQPVIDPWAEV